MMTLKEGLELMSQTEGAVLLDVRRPEEYAEGHVEGSINVPVNLLGGWIVPEGTKKIFAYCLSGARSARAVKFLVKMGYDAVNIGGTQDYDGPLVK